VNCCISYVYVTTPIIIKKKEKKKRREWVSDCCLTPHYQCSVIAWPEQVTLDEMSAFYKCTRPTNLIGFFYCVSSLKQQSSGGHAAPLGRVILISRQPALFFLLIAARVEKQQNNTNFIVFGLTWLGFEPTIYCTQGYHANHSTTDVVLTKEKLNLYYNYWSIVSVLLLDSVTIINICNA
jgi:hypothetical protein